MRIVLAAALVSGCATAVPFDRLAAVVTAAVAAETAAAVRCPKEGVERAAFIAGRAAFDLHYGALLSPIQANALLTSRAETDRMCFAAA